MKLRHIAIIGSLFPILFSIVLFFGVLISAEDDDGGNSYGALLCMLLNGCFCYTVSFVILPYDFLIDGLC